jgi:N-acetylglucosaminyldiphosphoundecaprenol N-acetyl-beta-D-mannosaminyltransferase
MPVSFLHPLMGSLRQDAAPAGVTEARCDLLGMPLNAITEARTLDILEERISAGLGTWVLTPNLDILRQYCFNPAVRPLFHAHQGGADMLLADGMPLIWASRIGGTPLPQRVPGSSLVWSLARRAAQKGWSIYLLGGAAGAAERAGKILQERNPGLAIAGTCCPEMGFDKDPAKLAEIRQRVVSARPTIVYVALGFPKQENVIRYLRAALPNATFIGVGISLSFIAGDVRRAPRWVQISGLEWVHRLAQEPRRLARRYLVDDAPFALLHLFPRAFAARWNVPGRSEPLLERQQMRPAAFAPVRRPGPTNPDDSEGRKNEGHHPRRRPGHTPEPPHQGDQQAPAPRLRQTDDHVSD